MTHEDIYKEFCEWSPEHAKMITDHKPWGSTSIVVWFGKDMAFKAKRVAEGKFIMQKLSDEDIKKKFG